MEFAMMDELVEACIHKGITTIYGYYYPTAKNGMVKDFYSVMGFEKVSEDDEGKTVWRLSVAQYSKQNNVIVVNDEKGEGEDCE